MSPRHLVLGALAALAILLSGRPAEAKYTPKVSLETARAAALERVPGTVIEGELEREKGRWVYEFEIKPKGETGKRVKEVTVDPESGSVLAVNDEEEDGPEGSEDEDGADDDGDDDDKAGAAARAKRGKQKTRRGRNPPRR